MAEQLKEIEIPFGAKDSELCGWEYSIPEGMEATIVDNKIVVKKKESGDEKIRKVLIHIVKCAYSKYGVKYQGQGISEEKLLAWLEKKGNIDLEFFENGENEKREFVGYGFLKCKGDFLSFKEGETYWLEYMGKDNYNVRSDNLLGQTFHITPQQLYTVFRPTTWLEKQGQNKLIDKVEPKFKVGDTVRFKGNETLKGEAETHKIVGYDNELYVFADGTTDLFCEQELYELVEQKSIAWSEEDEDMLQTSIDNKHFFEQLDEYIDELENKQ